MLFHRLPIRKLHVGLFTFATAAYIVFLCRFTLIDSTRAQFERNAMSDVEE